MILRTQHHFYSELIWYLFTCHASERKTILIYEYFLALILKTPADTSSWFVSMTAGWPSVKWWSSTSSVLEDGGPLQPEPAAGGGLVDEQGPRLLFAVWVGVKPEDEGLTGEEAEHCFIDWGCSCLHGMTLYWYQCAHLAANTLMQLCSRIFSLR